MPNDSIEHLARESDSMLEDALHARTSTDNATAVLTQLLWAFDARRRYQEARTIAETTKPAVAPSR